ncbi:MAG TPA: ATP-binding cassette domain-containing protein, partial [Flavisolibacter sp.]
MTPLAIETRQLSYSFDQKRKAVNDLSLQVPANSIYGFLGPNGAGKTTTIRLLAGMLPSDGDRIFLQGKSLKKSLPHIFESIGCLIETPSLYGHLTAIENLKVISILRGLPTANIHRVLDVVGLSRAARKKVKHFSLGMKQRLGIAMALLPDPQLLILDEPVNGLDPNGIIEVREMLIRINQQEGKTIFISSHLLNEIEKTCTHIGIINSGVLRYQGTLDQMKNTAYASGEVVFKIPDADNRLPAVQEVFSTARRQSRDEIIFPFSNAGDVSTINSRLVTMNIP